MSLEIRSALLAGASMLLACGDEGSIGQACGFGGTPCMGAETQQAIAMQSVSTAVGSLATLAPSWVKRDELGLQGELAGGSQLAAAGSGKLWLFRSTATHIEASLLDPLGAVVRTESIAPPDGLSVSRRPETNGLRGVTEHPRGPALTMLWRDPTCPEDISCTHEEVLVLGADASTPARRVTPPGVTPHHWFRAAYRTDDGEALYIPNENGPEIQKIDLDGTVLWTRKLVPRSLLKDVVGIDDPNDYAIVPWSGVSRLGAVSPTGALTLPIYAWERTGRGGPYLPAGLLQVTDEGDLTMFPHSGRFSSTLAGIGGTVAFEAQGAMRFAHSGPQGDLVVFRIHGQAMEGQRLVRNDEADLTVGATAIDSAGTLFLTTSAGAHDAPTPLMCRLPASGTGACFVIADPPQSLVAPAPNVVYALSSAGLARFDVP